ncbi:flavin reductase family protein [Arsenicicoccus piscis]|uniref:Oxidoreductase n=1 Tax=Arsenicicoccus piscis TaxID=673954 RepID=A0ABQ6HMI3_9MICO|nr:flavin reductase [Arsenicicoccus piscis]MCH8628995.1 flavin reductase family protein [Arsenicicoccus piscis]GMA19611.1 oxidoreductase [Arsenicicoccus piscis]
MSEDPSDLLMSSADPPLIVVTTVAGGARAGCLVGFHGQASIEPKHYAVWLSKANHTYRVALGATHLGVHFLGAGDLPLAERFGTTSGEDVDKFAGLEVTEGPGGLPLLAALPHRLVGRRSALLDVGGDHVCLPLKVESAESPGTLTPLRLHDAAHLIPGHEADERSVGADG